MRFSKAGPHNRRLIIAAAQRNVATDILSSTVHFNSTINCPLYCFLNLIMKTHIEGKENGCYEFAVQLQNETERYVRNATAPTLWDELAKKNSRKFMKNILKEPRRCAVCGGKSKKKCSRCQRVRYCCRKCQRMDWKAHKQTCVANHKVENPINTKGTQTVKGTQTELW